MRTHVYKENGHWNVRVPSTSRVPGSRGSKPFRLAKAALRTALIARDLADPLDDTPIALKAVEHGVADYVAIYKYPGRAPVGYRPNIPPRDPHVFEEGDHVVILSGFPNSHRFLTGDVVQVVRRYSRAGSPNPRYNLTGPTVYNGYVYENDVQILSWDQMQYTTEPLTRRAHGSHVPPALQR